jgi:hypothetical protein
MLTGEQLQIIAFWFEAEVVCRRCAVAKLGAIAVARVEHGLGDLSGWEAMPRWEIDERATDNAYGCSDGTHSPDHEGYCRLCDEVLCSHCGAKLDSPPDTPNASGAGQLRAA